MFFKQTVVLLCFFLFSCYFGEERESKPKAPVTPPLEQLAISLSEKGYLIQKERLIVLTFLDNLGKKSTYGEILAEKLTTELVKKDRFLILDRLAHQKILEKEGLSLDSSVDTSTLRKVGGVLGIQKVITGIVTPYQNGVFINTRLIEIQTGLILKADEVYVRIDD
ncbi:FlgO family outer membrane protein [Leptospira sp. 96542]|nr:FlgO family outer membrane protein [Leptospira sp. 96542]